MVRPRTVLIMTGKKHRAAAIIALDSWLVEAEPVVEQRREGEDRDRAGRDRERHQRVLHRAVARRDRPDDDPGGRADDQAADDLEERVAGGVEELGQVRLPGDRDGERARQDELLDLEDADGELPDDEEADEQQDRRAPVARPADGASDDPEPLADSRLDRWRRTRHPDRPSAATRRPSVEPGERVASSPRSASRTDRHEPEVRLASRASRWSARRGRSMSTIDAIRPGRADMTTTRVREEDGLGDRVGHEDDRRPGAVPDLEQLHVHPLAGHLVERSERLVHEQDRRVDRERTGDGDALLHAARQLPRVVAREVDELHERRGAPRLDGARSALGVPLTSSGSSTLAWTVRQSNRIGAWKTIP